MDKQTIIDYVMESPSNSNPAVMGSMLDEIGGGIVPSGTIEITENGEGIDVAEYATANVSVEGGGGSYTETLIWTNENPDEELEPFTIENIDNNLWTDNSFIKIEYKDSLDSGNNIVNTIFLPYKSEDDYTSAYTGIISASELSHLAMRQIYKNQYLSTGRRINIHNAYGFEDGWKAYVKMNNLFIILNIYIVQM